MKIKLRKELDFFFYNFLWTLKDMERRQITQREIEAYRRWVKNLRRKIKRWYKDE